MKINAYLEQELGFRNVGRLAGGVISYTKEMENSKVIEVAESFDDSSLADDAGGPKPIHLTRNIGEMSKFKGVNYVFDERMGARITADVLSQCETCGGSCDSFTNCVNYDCHIRFIQCAKCSASYNGCCCSSCDIKRARYVAKELQDINDYKASRQESLSRLRSDTMLPRTKKSKQVAVVDTVAQALVAVDVEPPAPSAVVTPSSTSSSGPSLTSTEIRIEDTKQHAFSLDEMLSAFAIYSEVMTPID